MAKKAELTEEQKAERKALFDAFRGANEEVVEAETLLEQARTKRSDAIKDIHEKFGPGPYRIDGQLLRTAARNGTYFFRSVQIDGEEV
jgi:hypothetical protein